MSSIIRESSDLNSYSRFNDLTVVHANVRGVRLVSELSILIDKALVFVHDNLQLRRPELVAV